MTGPIGIFCRRKRRSPFCFLEKLDQKFDVCSRWGLTLGSRIHEEEQLALACQEASGLECKQTCQSDRSLSPPTWTQLSGGFARGGVFLLSSLPAAAGKPGGKLSWVQETGFSSDWDSAPKLKIIRWYTLWLTATRKCVKCHRCVCVCECVWP